MIINGFESSCCRPCTACCLGEFFYNTFNLTSVCDSVEVPVGTGSSLLPAQVRPIEREIMIYAGDALAAYPCAASGPVALHGLPRIESANKN